MSEAWDHINHGLRPEMVKHPLVHNILTEAAASQILSETPLLRLAYLAEPGLWLPGASDVLPEWASPPSWLKIPRNRLKKVRLFVGRLNASYSDLCDDGLFDEACQRALVDCGPFGWGLNYGKVLLWASSTHRVFDSGHEGPVNEVSRIRKESLTGLILRHGINLPPGFGEIESSDSKLSGPRGDAIQAADVAAGLAKEDYQRAGIAGVRDRFRAVLYNGKVVR